VLAELDDRADEGQCCVFCALSATAAQRRRTKEVLRLVPATVSSGAQASRCGAHVGLLRDEPLAIHALQLELDDDVRSRAVPRHEEEAEVLNAVGVESCSESGQQADAHALLVFSSKTAWLKSKVVLGLSW